MAVNIALVGIGKIARDQHIPSIANEPGFTLAATASRNPDATVDGADAFPSLDALLQARPDIPAISLATPPQARFADAHLALSQSKHVMLEKPPGATLSEVHALEALARKNNVSLFATWHSREAAAVDAARAWLKDRVLTRLEIQWKEDVRYWHPGQEWIWEAGGLGVFDPGINALSVMTAILPSPVHLSEARLDFPSNRETPIAAALRFQGSDEAVITAELDWLETGPPKWTIDIETTDGAARLSEGGARFEADGTTVAGVDEEYARLYKHFAELIETSDIEVDLAPMRHVADAFSLGRRVVVDAFDW